MSASLNHIGIIGAGAWGTALATVAIRSGCRVTLWARNRDVAADINATHENTLYLPGIHLDDAITATGNLTDVAKCDALLFVTPAQGLRKIATDLSPHIAQPLPVTICSKGFERDTGKLLSDVLKHTLPQAIPCILSGPSFAADVANGLPTAVTLASDDIETAQALAHALGSPTFRPYASSDLIGAQIGGAIKNVLAIACGIVEGRSLGQSARAALTSRGFAELVRFGRAHGARMETLGGLSGLGDLILTCSSQMSRNMSLGYALGQGSSLQQVLKTRKTVTEGVYTAGVVYEIAAQKGLEMPICQAVRDIVEGHISVDEAIKNLMARPFTQE
jgi:glycerol-3-phosphate dehydrogenase (NAD(P)+)